MAAVRPFADLSEQGRVRRLHGLARRVLASYPFTVRRLRCIARETNTTFRVDTASGDVFALRVSPPPSDTALDTPSELAWLEALADAEGIDTVGPVPDRNGCLMSTVEHPGVDGPRTCVVFSWLPGRPVGDDAAPDDYRRLGVVAARLHDRAERWTAPAGFSPVVWDRVFYYPTEPVVLYEDRFRSLMTPERTRVVRAVEARAAAELTRLHRERPIMVLHGDLHPWNVHRHRDGLLVFDFEDVMLGAAVQDVAITLFYNRDRPDYRDLRAAFEEGYRSLRRWPVEYEGQLELLMAARTVMFINYVLRMGIDPEEHVPRMTGRIRGVLSRDHAP
jgi:Ser/Thr protein kinase RdoA (MazF antagonist)